MANPASIADIEARWRPLSAQEWSRFRGPNGTGISPSKTIPTRFSKDDFHYRVALPAEGHSSPIRS